MRGPATAATAAYPTGWNTIAVVARSIPGEDEQAAPRAVMGLLISPRSAGAFTGWGRFRSDSACRVSRARPSPTTVLSAVHRGHAR